MTMTGMIDGIVMYRACAKPFAPSMIDASYCSRIDARDRCQIDDRSPADALPDVGADQDAAKQPWIAQEQPALAAQQGDDVVDHAVIGVQHLADDAAQNDP